MPDRATGKKGLAARRSLTKALSGRQYRLTTVFEMVDKEKDGVYGYMTVKSMLKALPSIDYARANEILNVTNLKRGVKLDELNKEQRDLLIREVQKYVPEVGYEEDRHSA